MEPRNAACIYTPWELQRVLSFDFIEHMEVIFFCVCVFNVPFQTVYQPLSQLDWWFNQCSVGETAIHHRHGCRECHPQKV